MPSLDLLLGYIDQRYAHSTSNPHPYRTDRRCTHSVRNPPSKPSNHLPSGFLLRDVGLHVMSPVPTFIMQLDSSEA